MYKDAIIFQDIFNAHHSNVWSKKGTPGGWNDSSYVSGTWNGRRSLNMGTGVQSNANGMLVRVPSGYNVLWLRVFNDRWATFRVALYDVERQHVYDTGKEIYAGGFRKLNEISPDGAAPDSYWNLHMWMPIPLRTEGSYMVYSEVNGDNWISGIAFGKNLWNHAKNSPVAYVWKLNDQNGTTGHSADWNNDQYGYFQTGTVTELSVPVVYSGKDKLVYSVEVNDNWQGATHGDVWINGVQIERFKTTYQNPFAIHFNSKLYNRYLAARIPANLIRNDDKFVRLKIDLSKDNNHFHFRELGTHDY
jgi:hypothetical protein